MTFDHTTREDGLNFSTWLGRVDLFCRQVAGVGFGDLPDADHYSAFENGEDAKQYAAEMLVSDGFPANALPPDSPSYVPTCKTLPTFYVETITLSNGKQIQVERKHAANGYARIVGP